MMHVYINAYVIILCYPHNGVIKWKHFPRYWPFVRGFHRSPVNFPHKGQRRGAYMFLFICAWTNAWVNNRDAGDLRHHRTHYDVIVMGRLVSSIYWYYLPISISSARSTRKVIQVPARAIIMTTLHALSPMIPVKACTTSWKEFLRQMSLQCASIKSPTSVTSNDICGNIALHYPAIQPKPCFLNNCGIVTPYGHSELDQHCLR